jgi:pre-mRNA cleavage complex 2 protein Pcf11
MSLPAAEVAADFRDALQDLRMNSRPEISNLTLIAKENTEYAQAISTELEQHIKTVSPPGYCGSRWKSKPSNDNVAKASIVVDGLNFYQGPQYIPTCPLNFFSSSPTRPLNQVTD